MAGCVIAASAIGLGFAATDGRRPPPQLALATPETPPVSLVAAHEPERREDGLERRFAETMAGDRWVHPLAAPRRMPRASSQVFGARRPGERPPSCRSGGHCGVDIGGTWGEPAFAVSAGVVVRVVRRQNPEHGGRYVRLAHRDGKVFTQYFHLAGIPPWIQPGREVAAGELIGLLGSTGVHHSAPHLHFTISVRPDPESGETYMDPEPLIALWPVVDTEARGRWVSSPLHPPGAPRGATGSRRSGRASRVRGRPRPRTGRRDAGTTTAAPGDAGTVLTAPSSSEARSTALDLLGSPGS